VCLQGGLRKHERLRLYRDPQCVEHRPQVAAGRLERQLHDALLELAIQLASRVTHRPRRIGDGWVIARFAKEARSLSQDGHGERGRHGGERGDRTHARTTLPVQFSSSPASNLPASIMTEMGYA